MIKIFEVEQIRAADAYTIKHEPISSLDLMERAATKAFDWIVEQALEKQTSFTVFCGIGNNGGDGLVIARKLKEAGYQVSVFIVELNKNYAPDFQTNLERLPLQAKLLTEHSHGFAIEQDSIVIDAIFGTGLSRKVAGFAASVVDSINQSANTVISIDLPSGLFAEDNSENESHLVVHANYTLTFQFPKLAMLWPQSGALVGEWHLIDIGLHPEYIQNTPSKSFLFTAEDAMSLIGKRGKFAHKGTYGRALICAGSKGKIGAAVLAAKACLRSGVGLLHLQLPAIGEGIMQTAVPEAMVVADANLNTLSEWYRELNVNAIGVGPGIGQSEETINFLKRLIQEANAPLVLDADALNILAENQTWLSFLPKHSILTPHPGEFERLVGKWHSDQERQELLTSFAIKYQVYIVLKGQHTSIACPDGRVFYNSSGNPGMAAGGSGDALTGVITALLAQGHQAEQAALFGVFLHGLAGDIAADELGEIGMLPSDLIEAIPYAFQALEA